MFAHIETIAARSSLHDWEIAPHRHVEFVQVLLVESGQVDVTLDARRQVCAAPCSVLAPSHVVHGFGFVPGTKGYVLTLSADFVARAQGPGDPLHRLLGQGAITKWPPEQTGPLFVLAREMLSLLSLLPEETNLHLALAEAIARLLASQTGPAAGTATDARVTRFRALVERHFREHRALDFYAGQLGMTRRTLARLTAARLGASPKPIIDQRLTAEARRLLHYTNAGAAQVAAELGFDDPSWFSRFYLRKTGKRPSLDKRAAAPAALLPAPDGV